jgi:hypothetical protein
MVKTLERRIYFADPDALRKAEPWTVLIPKGSGQSRGDVLLHQAIIVSE